MNINNNNSSQGQNQESGRIYRVDEQAWQVLSYIVFQSEKCKWLPIVAPLSLRQCIICTDHETKENSLVLICNIIN